MWHQRGHYHHAIRGGAPLVVSPVRNHMIGTPYANYGVSDTSDILNTAIYLGQMVSGLVIGIAES